MKSDLGHAPRRQADRCPSGMLYGLSPDISYPLGLEAEQFNKLQGADVRCDFREPNVIRVAPTSLHTFQEVWRFAKILAEHR